MRAALVDVCAPSLVQFGPVRADPGHNLLDFWTLFECKRELSKCPLCPPSPASLLTTSIHPEMSLSSLIPPKIATPASVVRPSSYFQEEPVPELTMLALLATQSGGGASARMDRIVSLYDRLPKGPADVGRNSAMYKFKNSGCVLSLWLCFVVFLGLGGCSGLDPCPLAERRPTDLSWFPSLFPSSSPSLLVFSSWWVGGLTESPSLPSLVSSSCSVTRTTTLPTSVRYPLLPFSSSNPFHASSNPLLLVVSRQAFRAVSCREGEGKGEGSEEVWVWKQPRGRRLTTPPSSSPLSPCLFAPLPPPQLNHTLQDTTSTRTTRCSQPTPGIRLTEGQWSGKGDENRWTDGRKGGEGVNTKDVETPRISSTRREAPSFAERERDVCVLPRERTV